MAPTCPCISTRGMPHYVEKPVENGGRERPKKKRWSFGGLFKRKSKKETDTSSDDEDGKGFLRRKKQTGSKDVTGSFVVQGVGRRTGGSTQSLEVHGRKTSRVREPADSSSGDEGSYSSSLASGGGSLNRKSRSARTERYMRRKCEGWSPSPTRKPPGLQQRSGSEQVLQSKKIRAPLYVPPPPPLRPPVVSTRSVSQQYLSPPPVPHRKPITSLTNSDVSVASSRSDASNTYREYVRPTPVEKVELKKPPTPPERRSSRHSAVFPDSFEIKKRNSNNLEQALNELEAIYNSLKMGDDEADKNLPYGAGSGLESGFSTSQSSLNKRRPEKSDDMAFRRWNKKNPNVPDSRDIMSQAGSYLLLSPTASPPHFYYPREPNEPHVTLDDVVYRNINRTNNTLRILDPQPPFGIPLGPVTPAPQSDYLHVSPSQSTETVFKSQRVPDVVLDDLAFRNLRKDAQNSMVNMKKKKATRSLSANLANILLPNDKTHPVRSNYYEVNNNLNEYRSPSYSDIPQDLRLAQRMLDIRLMNLRNKIKDQDRHKLDSSTETLHNSNRSNSGTPERRTPTREPHRARFGADGQFKYSDLHPRTPPERRIVFREEWRRPTTPEKKQPPKDELRKKFFADAYKNIEKGNQSNRSKPVQKLTENPHHRIHFPHSKSAEVARTKPPRADANRTVVQQASGSSPVHQRTLTGEYFFPRDFEIPKSRKSPAADESHVGFTTKNTSSSPKRRGRSSPRTSTPPSSPVRSRGSSRQPTPEPERIEVRCNGHVETSPVPAKLKDTSRIVDSDSGRATPSGEEVRRILCPDESPHKTQEEKERDRVREEKELLRQLEVEAAETEMEMDRRLMSLGAVSTSDRSSNEVSSRRVTDLLRELTRSLDCDFGAVGGDPGDAPLKNSDTTVHSGVA